MGKTRGKKRGGQKNIERNRSKIKEKEKRARCKEEEKERDTDRKRTGEKTRKVVRIQGERWDCRGLSHQSENKKGIMRPSNIMQQMEATCWHGAHNIRMLTMSEYERKAKKTEIGEAVEFETL